jgi:hypothetical protein
LLNVKAVWWVFTRQVNDMQELLFIGTRKKIDINEILNEACHFLARIGVSMTPDLMRTYRVHDGVRTEIQGGLIGDDTVTEIYRKGSELFITVTQFENEIHPGYSLTTEPSLISVGIWTGADSTSKATAAGVAAAIAVLAGTLVKDAEHYWSDQDLNDPYEFAEKVRVKYKLSKK